MSLKPILDKLDTIKGTASKNAKIELLREYLEDTLFRRVVVYALHGLYHYNINKFPPKAKNVFSFPPDTSNKHKLQAIFRSLDFLRTAKGANDTDKYSLYWHCKETDEETVEVVRRIVTKKLGCGFSGKTVNKARPGTLLIMPYCGCSPENKLSNLVFDNDPEQADTNIIAQQKEDCIFCNVMIDSKFRIKFATRNGKTIQQLDRLRKQILDSPPVITNGTRQGIKHNSITDFSSTVIQGELMILKNGKILDLATGSGILNQCIQGIANPADARCAIIRVWDCIPLYDFWKGIYNKSYADRLFSTRQFVNSVGNSRAVRLVDTRPVHTLKEAQTFYSEVRNKGGEGLILKDRTVIWKFHKSPKQIKLKNVIDVELILTGWYHGKKGSKYEHCIGGLRAESSCGKLKVNLGTGVGFIDEFRGYHPWKHQVTGDIIDPLDIDLEKAHEACEAVELNVGAVIQCECTAVSKSKTKAHHSLSLPRFAAYRFDKDTADSLQDLLRK